MDLTYNGSELNQKTVLGHPSGLYILFFTEMWERFSYYGMRAILVLFLVSSFNDGGWGWERSEALALYGIYTGLVYITPIFGGLIADKFLGYRNAVILGAFVMTLGHASMAFEVFNDLFLYLGLIFLIIGNGFFKPNISSIVGQLYKTEGQDKDAGYTIFYMGINSGAFLGILLCGYIGENIGWHYGFGLAGVFMFLGMLQFYYAQKIFGNIGVFENNINSEKQIDKSLKKNKKISSKIIYDRLSVIVIFSLCVIFFWWAFEQAGGSMTIFASDYTNRLLDGSGALMFKIFNSLITIVPMIIISYIIYLLCLNVFSVYKISSIFLISSFLVIWLIIIWMLAREFNNPSTEVPASWYGILNSFYIIVFAPLISKIWQSKFNVSGPYKFGFGLISLAIGFAVLAYGSYNIPLGAKTASVSMLFLILAYFFHTIGELCISPVGLSYVSKLAPKNLVGLMFGVWFVANFIANTAAGFTGSYIDPIVENYGMSFFFLIFTVIPIAVGIIMLLANNKIVRMMHGVK
ncbi:peptide MFS transporter [Flavobacteriaceae bacterium]|nr:peptide MFS transporter [Flavobacteriaceae bacterium]